jgi:hypothetical protein
MLLEWPIGENNNRPEQRPAVFLTEQIMPILSKPSFGPRTAIIYITAGALIDVWTIVWYLAFARGSTMTSNTQFWLWGFFLTGLTLVVVGMLLGHIGRAARRAELPPPETTLAEAQIQATAAAHPNPMVAGGLASNIAPAPQAAMPAGAIVPAGLSPPATAAQVVQGIARRGY